MSSHGSSKSDIEDHPEKTSHDFGLTCKFECHSFDTINCQAKLLTARIFRHYQGLAEILERHESLIRKRWIKKTRQQRVTTLLAAFPTMPKQHRPDVNGLHRPRDPIRKMWLPQWQNHFLLPSINLEDLCLPKNLLLFLHSRGRNHPVVFVKADFKSVHIGLEASDLVLPHVHGYSMQLSEHSPDAYGRLRYHSNDDDMLTSIRIGDGVLPGVGMLTLVIQERKLSFLLGCAELILHDISIKDLSFPLQEDPGEVTLATDESQRASLSLEILEAPYRLPPTFDISRLRSLVYAKRAACEDEIWALREDPIHFKETVYEWGEHRREQLRTAFSKYGHLEEDFWWEVVIMTMVADTYASFACWDTISQHLEKLISLKDTSVDRDDDGRMPDEYEDEIAFIEYAAVHALGRPWGQWRDALPASPPLRKHFLSDPKTGIAYPKIPPQQQKDKFLFLIQMPLFRDVLRFDVGHVMDAIQWMMDHNVEDKNRVTPLVAQIFSELSLLGELRRQINLLTERPLSTKDEDDLNKKSEQLVEETKGVDRMFGIFQQKINIVSFVIPLDKFNYPIHKRRTAETTRSMQQAECALDHFWDQLDEHCENHGGQTLHQLFAGAIEHRQIFRTPDWSEPDTGQPSAKPTISPPKLEEQVAAWSFQDHQSERTDDRDVTPLPKQKIKTRGLATQIQSEPGDISHEPDTTAVTPKIGVTKRALKVFSTLFFDDAHEAPLGETPWSEFLHAMTSAGFTAQKQGGSSWLFAPTDDNFRRSIIFHEPHPVAKIDYRVARRMGRRLERAYGWTGETFERGRT